MKYIIIILIFILLSCSSKMKFVIYLNDKNEIKNIYYNKIIEIDDSYGIITEYLNKTITNNAQWYMKIKYRR